MMYRLPNIIFSKDASHYLKILEALSLLSFFILLIFWLVIQLKYPYIFIDSDQVGGMLLYAYTAAKNNTLFPTNFYYPTEYLFLWTSELNILLFKFIDDWSVVKALGNFISYILVSISLFLLLSYLKVKKIYIYLALILLFFPIGISTVSYTYITITHGAYILYLFYIFFLIYALLKLSLEGLNSKSKAILFSLALLISFLLGLQSVRILMVFLFPLLIVTSLSFFIYNLSSIKEAIRLKPRRREILNKLNSDIYFHIFKFSLIIFLSAAFGYILHSKVLRHLFSVAHFSKDLSFNYIVNTLFTENYLLKSIIALKELFSLPLLIFYLFLTLFIYIKFFVKKLNGGGYRNLIFITSVYLVSITVILITCAIFKFNIPRYFAITYALSPVILAIFLNLEEKAWIRMITISIAILLYANSFGNYYKNLKPRLVSYDKNNKIEVASYMLKNGLDMGYASFWNANYYMQPTNGKVEMAPIILQDDCSILPYKWITLSEFFDYEYVKSKEKPFLLLTKEEFEKCRDTQVVQKAKSVDVVANYYIVIVEKVSDYIILSK